MTDIADTLDGRSREASEDQENTPRIMKILKFNLKGLPIGPGAGTAALVLGKLARSQIPIRFKRWTNAPKERKDLMWLDFKKDYNFTDAQKVVMMRKASVAWKKHKATLGKRLKGSDIQRESATSEMRKLTRATIPFLEKFFERLHNKKD